MTFWPILLSWRWYVLKFISRGRLGRFWQSVPGASSTCVLRISFKFYCGVWLPSLVPAGDPSVLYRVRLLQYSVVSIPSLRVQGSSTTSRAQALVADKATIVSSIIGIIDALPTIWFRSRSSGNSSETRQQQKVGAWKVREDSEKIVVVKYRTWSQYRDSCALCIQDLASEDSEDRNSFCPRAPCPKMRS